MQGTGQWRTWIVALALIAVMSGILVVGRRRAEATSAGVWYTPLTGDADWQGHWEFSARGADPSEAGSLAGTDRATIRFTGTGLDLRVRKGNYRGYLWVRVDGSPANRLPQTERGAYLVLSSSDYTPQAVTVPAAGGLDNGPHVAEVVADRGWDQWPLMGWRVRRGPGTAAYDCALSALAAAAAVCVVVTVGGWGAWLGRRETREPGNGSGGQNCLRVNTVAPILQTVASGPSSPAALLITAGVFYISPWLPLTLVSGVLLAALIVLRLDLGLALVALSAPFYLHPRLLLGKSFSMAEISILLCLGSWGLRQVTGGGIWHFRQAALSRLDYGVLFLVVVAAFSTLFATHQHVALRELRVVILEPALVYLMVRTTKLDQESVWRIVDGFVGGAALVALVGLVQYAAGMNTIAAEEGFRRLRSVYGSPNNAALYLGRALPVLLAVAAFGMRRPRRIAYGGLAVPVAAATLLSFSRGALLLGVPASLLVLGLLAGGRWRWIALGLAVAAAVAMIPLWSTPRFAGLLDPHSGTLFFRFQLWRASWKMFLDHIWLGVGPDNFLYQYRGRYILPSAWQEPHLSHAHNLLLTYATRLGIPGLVAGLWLHGAFWWEGVKLVTDGDTSRRALALGLMGSMAYALAHGLVDASTFFVDLALAFLLGLALVQWVRRYSTDE